MGTASLIVVKTNGEDGQRYVLDSRNWCTIGSHPECDIIVHSKGVAKLHALILHSAEKGAQVFGLDESLPTVCPSKKAILYKDDGAGLERGDIIIVGEREFRFEDMSSPQRLEGLTDATNAPSGDFAASSRRSSLIVRDKDENTRRCTSARTVMTERRLSLPASAVVEGFFSNSRSPIKRKSVGHSQDGVQTEAKERTVTALTHIARARIDTRVDPALVSTKGTPQKSRQQDSSLERLLTPGRISRPETAPKSQAGLLTPRRAAHSVVTSLSTKAAAERERANKRGREEISTDVGNVKMSDAEYMKRMTPRRAPARQATQRAATPRRVEMQLVSDTTKTSSAEYEMRMTPRRARQPNPSASHSPEAAASVSAHLKQLTPRRRRRTSSENREEAESALISNRVAAESPLFARPAKRARTTTKAKRPVQTHRDVLALATPKRTGAALRRSDLSGSLNCASAASLGDVVEESKSQLLVNTDKSEGIRPGDTILQFDDSLKDVVRGQDNLQQVETGEIEDTDLPDHEAFEEDEEELEVGAFTPRPNARHDDGDDFQASDSSLEEVQLTAKKVEIRRLSDTSNADCAQAADVGSPRAPQTPRAVESCRRTPKVTPKSGTLRIPRLNLDSAKRTSSDTRGKLSVPRSRHATPVAQRFHIQRSNDDGGDSPDTLYAGTTPAARMQPMSRQSAIARAAATESKIQTKTLLDHTPEKQVRSTSAVKQCLSQKPRSAISKSARKGKGRRKSSTLRKTVLFADTIGADIELTSGPHYSPPPKPRGSPRHQELRFERDSSDKNPCPSPPRRPCDQPVKNLPRPSPGVDQLDGDISNHTIPESSHVLGPPPSTPLGRLGLFFYPTRPAYPLLTNGDGGGTDEALSPPSAVDGGSVGSPSSREDSSSSEGLTIPVSLPFTEDDAEVAAISPAGRRSLLGGIASFGSYAAGSVLRRLSGAKPVDAGNSVNPSSTVAPIDSDSLVDAERNNLAASTSRVQPNEFDSPVDANTFNDLPSSNDMSEQMDVEEEHAEASHESEMDDQDPNDCDQTAWQDALSGNPSDGVTDGPVEPRQDPQDDLELETLSAVDTQSAITTPRRQSLIGRGMTYLFGGSAKKEQELEGTTDAIAGELSSSEHNSPFERVDEKQSSEVPVTSSTPTCAGRHSTLEPVNKNAEKLETENEHAKLETCTTTECQTSLDGMKGTEDDVPLVASPSVESVSAAKDVQNPDTSQSDLGSSGNEIGHATVETFSNWTVKELRELLSGLGYSFNGLRKAELIQQAIAASQFGRAAECDDDEGETEADDVQEHSADDFCADAPTVDFSRLTVVELREKLSALGLETAGRKLQLITRLEDASGENDTAVLDTDSDPTDDPDSTSSDGETDSVDASPVNAEESYISLSVKELRAILAERELCSTGRKDTLIQRLLDDDKTTGDDDGSDIGEESPSPGVKAADVDAMTVVQLRAALSAANLDSAGRKAELQQRLLAALTSAAGAKNSAAEEDVENDDDAWKSKDAGKLTVVQLRDVLRSNAMCAVGSKARLVQKVKILQNGTRLTRRKGDNILTCQMCEQGKPCEASA